MFGVAAVLGAGGAVVLVSALDLVATLVGDRSVCNGKSSTIELIVDQYLKYLALQRKYLSKVHLIPFQKRKKLASVGRGGEVCQMCL